MYNQISISECFFTESEHHGSTTIATDANAGYISTIMPPAPTVRSSPASSEFKLDILPLSLAVVIVVLLVIVVVMFSFLIFRLREAKQKRKITLLERLGM